MKALDWSRAEIAPFVSAIHALASGKDKCTEYEQRMVEFLCESHGLKNPEGADGAKKRRRQKELKREL